MSKEGKDLEELINTVSKRMSTDPQKLREAADKGNVNEIMKKLSPKDAQKIQSILSDKNATSKLLSTPKAQQLLKKFMGEK